MHALWHWLLYLLTLSSADAGMLDSERARTAGSVAVAYASLAIEPIPAPKPQPQNEPSAQPVCKKCNGTERIYRADGGWVKCHCGACANGRCASTKEKATQ